MTKGLAVFCGREVEFDPIAESPAQLAVRVMRLGADVLGHARIPNNGSPFGVTEGDQSRVTLLPSLFAPHSPAIRLTAESLITLKAG